MSAMFGGGFKGSKCKTLLRLAMARIKLLRNKRDIQIKQMRKDIAQLLASGQEPSARIRVEHIAREQNIMAAYDIIELFCELIIVRLPIIESQKLCPLDLKEAVCSLIFASQRCADLPELLQVRGLFNSKYGKEFVAAATELRPDCGVNRRIIEKLSVRAPSGEVKLKLLTEIAAEHNVSWDPSMTEAELMKAPEDLLDGPKSFFGPSQTPIIDLQPLVPKSAETVAQSQRPTSAPHQASAPVSVPHSDSDEETVPDDEKQFIPFLRPVHGLGVAGEKAKEGSRATTKGSSSVSNSKENVQARPRNEGKMEYEKRGDYDDVAAAAAAAAKSADRAVAAARAAAELAKTHPSQRDSLSRRGSQEEESSTRRDPLSRRGSREEEYPTNRDPPSRQGSREEEYSTKRDLPPRQGSREEESSSKGGPLPRRGSREEDTSKKGDYLSKHGSREEESSSSGEDSEEDRPSAPSKDEIARQEKNDISVRRKDSGYEEKSDIHHNRRKPDESHETSINRSNSEDKQESIFRRSNSNDRQEVTEDFKAPIRFDGGEESFWKGGGQDWQQGSYLQPEKDTDSDRFFNNRGSERDSLFHRNSDVFKSVVRDEFPTSKPKDTTWYNNSKVYSSSDSSRSLFRKGNAEDVDLRSSDETPFYDTQQGLPTPKFDEDVSYSKPAYTSELPFKKEFDSQPANFDNPKSNLSFNDFWRSSSMPRSPDDELSAGKFGTSSDRNEQGSGRLHSDSRGAFDTHLSGSTRDGSENLSSGSYETGDMLGSSVEDQREQTSTIPIPTKSRRTRSTPKARENLDGTGSGGLAPPPGRPPRFSSNEIFESSYDSPEERSSPIARDSSRPQSFDDSPGFSSKTSLPFHNSSARTVPPSDRAPSSLSRESPDKVVASPPGSTGLSFTPSPSSLERKDSPTLHPKLSDIDDLTARFEALKGKARR